jgi:hypothetical protein
MRLHIRNHSLRRCRLCTRAKTSRLVLRKRGVDKTRTQHLLSERHKRRFHALSHDVFFATSVFCHAPHAHTHTHTHTHINRLVASSPCTQITRLVVLEYLVIRRERGVLRLYVTDTTFTPPAGCDDRVPCNAFVDRACLFHFTDEHAPHSHRTQHKNTFCSDNF